MFACHEGKTEIVKLLLEENAGLNHVSRHGATAFSLACPRPKILEILLNHDHSYINTSIPAGQIDGSAPLSTPLLEIAAESDRVEAVNLLLTYGANVNQRFTDGETILSWAVKKGHENVVSLLINKGIDINQVFNDQETILSWAVKKGHANVVSLLINKGIDLNQVLTDGEPALSWAAKNGHANVVDLLINKGIDINQVFNNRETALSWAAKNDHSSVVSLLVEKGIDINQVFNDQETILSWAAKKGHSNVVDLLIEKGIDVNQVFNNRETALDIAAQAAHSNILNKLLSSRAYKMNLSTLLFSRNLSFMQRIKIISNALNDMNLFGRSPNNSSKTAHAMRPVGPTDLRARNLTTIENNRSASTSMENDSTQNMRSPR